MLLRRGTPSYLSKATVLPVSPIARSSFRPPSYLIIVGHSESYFNSCSSISRCKNIAPAKTREKTWYRSFRTCQPVSNQSENSHKMTELKAGDKFPDGVVFSYVPYTPESESITACGIPQNYNASKEWADKKVVLFAVPGAFTPGCSVKHLPGYIENLEQIKGKGVDVVAVIAFNDAFVMNAWSKANGVKNDDILFMNDPETKFSKSIGWTKGERTARYAIVIDHGKIVYAEKEPAPGVTVSGVEAVMSKI